MPTLRIEKSLDEITTGYTLFEADQVLTHDQLNSVALYADDQLRLSRVKLGGVGIACGLRVSQAGSSVRVSGGVGVTTDGDLLYLDGDTVFDRWRVYDASYPAYPPLYTGGDVNAAMLTAYELIPAGTTGAPGQPMSGFAAATGRAVNSLTAVLLMESYRKDDDLCSGTDCDNLGAQAVNTRKLILVEPAAVAALRGTPPATPASVYAAIPELVAERPALGAALTSPTQLADTYRAACNLIHARLVAALPAIHANAGALLGTGVVAAGSAAAWTGKLAGYKTSMATSTVGVQYYYDFLKDVVEAYNEFREHLFADDTWCSPPIASFPKHLILGDFTSASASRTGYYPSPVTSRTAGELEHARFLVQRLDALINGFAPNTAANLPVRVTPSAWEDRPLGERAIPFYYTPGGTNPIHRRWSYERARRGTEVHSPSYHAASYAPAGSAAANPLAFQIGRATFFRVEGVIGKPVQTAIDALEALIRDRNLPFTVRAVLLGSNRAKVVKRPGRRITPLHQMHQVIRKDASERLLQAESFTTKYSASVAAVTVSDVFHADESTERLALQTTAASKGSEVVANAASARTKAAGNYTQYRANAAPLQLGISATVQAGADLVHQVSAVATTGYANPIDSLMVGAQSAWLPWIDEIVDWQDGKADAKLLFSTFAAEHPQAEHFGGVARGGTLVLVHEEVGNTVVAEVMLPYSWREEPVDEDEPVLLTPRPEPPSAAQPPVRAIPTRKLTFEKQWTGKEPQLNVITAARDDVTKWLNTESTYLRGQMSIQTAAIAQDKLGWQTDLIRNVQGTYDQVLSNSYTMQTSAVKSVYPQRESYTTAYTDKRLGLMVDETRFAMDKVNTIRELVDGGDDDDRLIQELEAAQLQLSTTLQRTTEHLVASGTDVTVGGEGLAALGQMKIGIAALEGTELMDATREGITDKVANVDNMLLRAAVQSIIPG
ncbi:MAG TPA: hypothetical protein VE913_22550 [Longimicrobium sp.]|nr:hypothetical protein [Longimicrobium sp.]